MITFLIIYAALITILYICCIFGKAQERQDSIISLKHDRICINDLIQQLSETKTNLADLEIENANLKQVIKRQDDDLTTCHKLMKQSNINTDSENDNSRNNNSKCGILPLNVNAPSCHIKSTSLQNNKTSQIQNYKGV